VASTTQESNDSKSAAAARQAPARTEEQAADVSFSSTMNDKITIIFDQGHKNLLDLSSDTKDDQSFSKLVNLIREDVGFQISDPVEGGLVSIPHPSSRVLVFAAPTGQLTGDEIKHIWYFVQNGGGLLLLNNANAFRKQLFGLNTLAGKVGCRFGFHAAHEPLALRDFKPHYISGSVDVVQLQLKKTDKKICSRIILSESDANLEPIASNDYSLHLVAGTYQRGRIVVAGNTAMFSNKYIAQPGNRRLAVNIFRWLARDNPFEFIHFTPHREVELGQRYVFEIGLRNPTDLPTKIQEISLASSVNDKISQPLLQNIVLYPDQDGSDVQRLRWEIEPQDVLGDHVLRLEIRYEQGQALYRRMTAFTVVMPGHSRLTISKKNDDFKRDILVGEPFKVIGTGALSGLREQSVEFTPELDYPKEQLRQTQSAWPTELRWTFVAKAAGTHPIALRLVETGQTVQAHVRVKESDASQIQTITTRFVKPLDDEIRRLMPGLSSALATPELAQVPFNLLTVEDYIALTCPFEPAARQVWDAVEAGYWEERENKVVVADLLYNLAPMYMPRAGAFIPFAPDLVNRLLKSGTSRRRELLINFLKGDEVTDIEMRRLIAAYLSHEKYGHGFFYVCTKLGQQLAVLDKHRFLDKYAKHILRKPYPQALYDSYAEAIQVLQHSALIANEGFAAWLELNILHRMAPDIHAIIRERENFMQEAKTLRDVKRDSLYFDKFPPAASLDSPYEEARRHLDGIQKLYPEEYGVKCAIQAFLVAASIPLGITDGEEAPSFALTPDVLRDTILKREAGNARSDIRLWRIRRVLEDTRTAVRAVQERLQCHADCLHPECPVRVQIAEKLDMED
jgi:hypothetical protein